MRQRHGDRAFLVGPFSYEGTVCAAPDWDTRGRVYDMRPALSGQLFRTLPRDRPDGRLAAPARQCPARAAAAQPPALYVDRTAAVAPLHS